MKRIKNVCSFKKCTGCGACQQSCPRKAIKLEYSTNGFYHPSIDFDSCVGCGKCRSVCQVLQKISLSFPLYQCAASKLNLLGSNCTSGGVADAIATTIIDRSGIVYGAAFNPSLRVVKHVRISDRKGLNLIQGSKYIQSENNDSFQQVKKDLLDGKEVLFIGTPCQVAGLKLFLGKNPERLYTIDFMCHGVMSTKVFRLFLDSISSSPVASLNFREKTSGYNMNCHLKIVFSNGETWSEPFYHSSLGLGYSNNLLSRDSCFSCPFASLNRVADISLCDLMEEKNPSFGDKGCSGVLVNTNKGLCLFNDCRSSLIVEDKDISLFQGFKHFSYKPQINKNRSKCFRKIDKYGYKWVSNRYFPFFVGKCAFFYRFKRLGRKLLGRV